MSNFTVDWPHPVRVQLAAVWLNSPNRNAVTKAEAAIHHALQVDPIGRSQHLSEGLYKLHIALLTVFHSVDEIARKVEVQKVVHDLP